MNKLNVIYSRLLKGGAVAGIYFQRLKAPLPSRPYPPLKEVGKADCPRSLYQAEILASTYSIELVG
jgi:hypothetical protein